MSDLYTSELREAADALAARPLPAEATHQGEALNPFCGDRVTVGFCVVDGRLTSIGFDVRGCLVCRASAERVAAALEGHTARLEHPAGAALSAVVNGARRDPRFDALASVADHPARVPCALLPWRAFEDALLSSARLEPPARVETHAPIDDVWAAVDRMGPRVAVATLVSAEGSSPCPVGSRMVVDANGDFWGSVSGGCVEAEVVHTALDVIARGDSQIGRHPIVGRRLDDAGLACGGVIRVHVGPPPSAAQLTAIGEASGREAALVTDLVEGGSRVVERNGIGDEPAALSAAIEAAMRGETPREVRESERAWFVEPLLAPPALILVGATHIAQVLASLAPTVGFEPIVVDPRGGFASAARFPDARLLTDDPARALAAHVDARSAVVTLSHEHHIDDPALTVALRSDAFYVAALGSRRTQRARLERLRAAGLDEASLRRLHGPAGLSIGGRGAGEIAVSILAELVAVRRLPRPPRVGAVVLAAGLSRRAGADNKLLWSLEGEAIVRRAVRRVRDAGFAPCVVVVGHEADAVRAALTDLDVEVVDNARYADGIGRSVAVGIDALEGRCDAALIALGDMPHVRVEDLRRLAAAHQPDRPDRIVAPVADDGGGPRLGNPVLWPGRYFNALRALDGDQGGRRLLREHAADVVRVPIKHVGVLVDVDDEASASAQGLDVSIDPG